MNKYYAAVILGIILTSFSQILLKLGARKKKNGIKFFWDWQILAGYCLLFIVVVLNVFAMQEVEVKILTALVSLNYLFVTILSKIILKEKITKKKIAGLLFIILGLIIY